MSNFESELQLVNQNGAQRFEIGDTAELIIRLFVREGFVCKGILIQTWWFTHGKGIEDSGLKVDHTISGQQFEPGEYEFRKTFIIPPGPTTFHGYYINIDWCVEVQIFGHRDLLLRDGLKFKVSEKPYLNPVPTTRQVFDGYKEGVARVSTWRKLFLILLGVSFLFLTNLAVTYESPKLALIPGFLFSAFVVFLWNRKLKKLPFNNFLFDINTLSARSGQPIDIGISFDAGSAVQILDIVIYLIGYEVAKRRNSTILYDGPSIITEERESFRQRFEISGPIDSIKNQLNRTKKTITIPPNLPASFDLKFNELRWELELHLHAEGCPTIQKIRHLKIV